MSGSADSALFQSGDVLDDRFRIVGLVGRGGTGEIYEATELESDKQVAIKTVLPEFVGNRKIARRFEREKDFSQRISHPNVLRIDELFEAPLATADKRDKVLVPCMVMEFLKGETVADRLIRGETFTPGEARPLICQMAAALSAAHKADIVHRDLKPDNMFLVDPDSSPPLDPPEAESSEAAQRVVLTDFGVARQTETPKQKEESLTASNVLLGTPTYMAPEQLELEKAMPASDIYTLGLVMFEMLTGRRPFEAESAIKMVFKRVKEDAPSPRIHLPDLDRKWEEVILRCLERDPANRFEDVEGVIHMLAGDDSQQWLTDEGDAKRRRLLMAAAALIVLLLIAAAIFFVG